MDLRAGAPERDPPEWRGTRVKRRAGAWTEISVGDVHLMVISFPRSMPPGWQYFGHGIGFWSDAALTADSPDRVVSFLMNDNPFFFQRNGADGEIPVSIRSTVRSGCPGTACGGMAVPPDARAGHGWDGAAGKNAPASRMKLARPGKGRLMLTRWAREDASARYCHVTSHH